MTTASGLLLAALGVDPDSHWQITIEGEPVVKSRPRFGRGKTYTNPRDRVAEAHTAAVLRDLLPEPLSGNVAIACVFHRPNRNRADVDNLLKHVLDAANGVLFADDSQVTGIVGAVELDEQDPRTEVAIGEHSSSMTRGSDWMIACAVCQSMFTPATATRRYCSRACAGIARRKPRAGVAA